MPPAEIATAAIVFLGSSYFIVTLVLAGLVIKAVRRRRVRKGI